MTPVSYTLKRMNSEAPSPEKTNLGGVARAFVLARRQGRHLAAYPGPAPGDLAAAYRIQDEALQLYGRAVVGWKVGRIPDSEVTRLGANRLAGPILAGTVIFNEPGIEAAMPAFAGGFIAVESEFMLRLRVPPHGTAPPDDASAKDWIDDVRIGVELASSPYPGINDDGACVTISDFGNNAGVLLGPSIADWRDRDLGQIAVTTEIDGVEVGRATASTMLDGPYGAVRFLIEHLRSRGIAPQSGWWISSGAVTGVHAARIGDRAAANFEGVGSLSCRIIPTRG